jgi:hypothetical protein
MGQYRAAKYAPNPSHLNGCSTSLGGDPSRWNASPRWFAREPEWLETLEVVQNPVREALT